MLNLEVVLSFSISTNREECTTNQLTGLQTHETPTTAEDINSPTHKLTNSPTQKLTNSPTHKLINSKT